MAGKALYVGGCPAPYHRIEPTIQPIGTALAEIGLTADVSGIYHPDNTEAITGDYTAINSGNLVNYDVVVLFTTGQERRGADVPGLKTWVREGGAIVGIHCATDSFTDDPDYVAMMGGKFRTHPAPLDIAVTFTDTEHAITKGLNEFTTLDELYLFADYDPDRVHLLAQTTSYDDNGPVPVCWTREEGEGRIFFISLGHMPETMAHPGWRAMFQRGTLWSMKKL